MRKFLFIAMLRLAGSIGASESDSLTPRLDALDGKFDGLNESYLETKSTVDKLSRIKVSGYIQTQWQLADSAGVPSMAGGNFSFGKLNWFGNDNALPRTSDSLFDTLSTRQRFMIRRARIKTTYETNTSKYVLEFDVLPTGLSIKDANVTLMEPWLKTFSATMGIMDRPFGFEVPYSSSSLETPERTRMAQVVFPGEKDLGAKIEINPNENMGVLQYLNLKAGLFTGMGGNNPSFNEVDNHLDFIGRASFHVPFYDQGLELDGGVSTYAGTVQDRSDLAIYTKPIPKWVAIDGDSVQVKNSLVVTIGNKDKLFDRRLYGIDAQAYYDVPVIGGASLRGEYVWGRMPGTLTSNSPYYVTGNATLNPLNPVDVLERKVEGWYVMFVQNMGKLLQAVVRYDVFDPNTDASGSDIIAVRVPEEEASASQGNLTHLQTLADLKYSTFGVGLNYFWDSNLRLSLYYDMVTNENVNSRNADTLITLSNLAMNPLSHYRKDLKDNVLTFRAQIKF
jgi:hypothetical protein